MPDINNNQKIQESLNHLLTQLREKSKSLHQTKKTLLGVYFKYPTHQSDIKNLYLGIKRLQSIHFIGIDHLASVKRLIEADRFFAKTHALREFNFPRYQSVIDPFFLQYAKMELECDAFKECLDELFYSGYRGHHAATTEAEWVFSKLKELNQQYFINKEINYDNYKSSVLRTIQQARPILAQHQGYQPLLINLMVLISTLGTAFLVNKVVNGHFLFFPTTGTQLLNKIDDTLNSYSLPLNNK